MFKPLRFLAFAALLTANSVSACLNEYQPAKIPLNNEKLNLQLLLNSPKNELPYWHHGFNRESLERIEQVNSRNLAKMNYRELSDYAVVLLKLGRIREAIQLLEKLYQQRPNEYNIVANLGTAYELNGNNEKALEFLKKAVAINPISHFDSEWIHIRILEQELASYPDYKKIIRLNTGDFQQWLADKTYRFPRPADSLKLQIAYQLHERIGFIAPPNKVIGQLVTDFADIVAKTDSLGAAKEFYDYALQYDPALKDSIVFRVKSVEASEKEVKNTFRWASAVWAIPLVVLLLIFFAWLKSMRSQKRSQQ